MRPRTSILTKDDYNISVNPQKIAANISKSISNGLYSTYETSTIMYQLERLKSDFSSFDVTNATSLSGKNDFISFKSTSKNILVLRKSSIICL